MIADTPEAIELFGLIVLKGDLKLLKKGIGRKGYNARGLARKRYPEMKTRDLDLLIARVEEEIEEKSQNPASRPKRL